MSGGVDSSVAAAFAQNLNYEVLGVTLNLKHPDDLLCSRFEVDKLNDREVRADR